MKRVRRAVRARWKGATALTAVSVVAVFGLTSVSSSLPALGHQHVSHQAKASTTHSHGVGVNVSREQLREVDTMLASAEAATLKYRAVGAAIADGYRQEGPNRPGEGSHFINRRILAAGVFNIEQPTFLLYEHQIDWSYELVGIGWLLPKSVGDATPPPYFAPLAAWHFHEYPPPGICIWKDGTTNPYAETNCRSRGGMFWPESPWMLHVWLYRSSPEGVFSLVNSSVKGIEVEDFAPR